MTDEMEGSPHAPTPPGGHEIEATGARSVSSNGDRLDELFKFVQRTSPPQHPHVPDISRVLEPKHIDESIKLTDKMNERFFDDRRHRRRVLALFGGGATASVVAVILVLVFTGNAELVQYLIDELVPIVTGVVGGGGGLALFINWHKLRE